MLFPYTTLFRSRGVIFFRMALLRTHSDFFMLPIRALRNTIRYSCSSNRTLIRWFFLWGESGLPPLLFVVITVPVNVRPSGAKAVLGAPKHNLAPSRLPSIAFDAG